MDSPDIPPDAGLSYITPIGYSNSTSCGYCNGKLVNGKQRKRFSYYALSHSLSPQLYQDLLDRCWRRSGNLIYRPNQKNMCCPHYTLRLDATNFHAIRDQRQAVNRFNRFVTGDAYAKEAARLCPRSREDAKRRETVFDLTERLHEAEADRLPLSPKGPKVKAAKDHDNKNQQQTHTADPLPPITPAHKFEVTLEPDTFTEEKYLVYENYQRVVHKEAASKITRSGFASFLCNSPLRRETSKDTDGTERKLGSFHQCYRLDGRLVAIGVLDLLPHCVSAVYFLYHESIHQHNPGKLGALREISLAREAGYQWWYSGYYIHSCPKMRYKFDYAPQYVLDPETLKWDLLDKETLTIFDKKEYVSLSNERRIASGEVADVVEGHSKNGKDNASSDVGAGDADSDNEDDDVPLLTSNMPGLPSLDYMAGLNLDKILIRTDFHPAAFHVEDLTVWAEGSVRDSNSFKCRIAELVAAMGPDLMPGLCLDFQHHKKQDYY